MGCSFIAKIQKVAGKVLRPIAKVASVIPGPWQVPAMAAMAIDSAVNGDIKGALLSGFGALGGAGLLSNVAKGLGATGAVANAAATGAMMGGLNSAVHGENVLEGAALGGLMGGAGSYLTNNTDIGRSFKEGLSGIGNSIAEGIGLGGDVAHLDASQVGALGEGGDWVDPTPENSFDNGSMQQALDYNPGVPDLGSVGADASSGGGFEYGPNTDDLPIDHPYWNGAGSADTNLQTLPDDTPSTRMDVVGSNGDGGMNIDLMQTHSDIADLTRAGTDQADADMSQAGQDWEASLNDTPLYQSQGGGVPDALKDVIKGMAPEAAKALIGAFTTNQVNKSVMRDFDHMFDKLKGANQFADMSNPKNQAMYDNITNTLAGNSVGQRTLEGLISSGPSQSNMYKRYADAGYGAASRLATDPYSHQGYKLADVASRSLQDLYTNPMANPIMAAVGKISGENAMRSSAAGRGIQSGSYEAELRDATLASLGKQFNTLANPLNDSVGKGSQWYQGDLNAYTQLGHSAASDNTAQNNADINAWNAHANAANSAWANANTGANIGGNLMNSHINALGGLAQLGLQADWQTNPTAGVVRGLSNAGNKGGTSAIDKVVNAGTDWLLGKVFGSSGG